MKLLYGIRHMLKFIICYYKLIFQLYDVLQLIRFDGVKKSSSKNEAIRIYGIMKKKNKDPNWAFNVIHISYKKMLYNSLVNYDNKKL